MCLLRSPKAFAALFETFYITSKPGSGRERDSPGTAVAVATGFLLPELRGKRRNPSETKSFLSSVGSSDVLGLVGIPFEISADFHMLGV